MLTSSDPGNEPTWPMLAAPSSYSVETPVGVLASLDLGGYDRTIADFRKKNAEREAAQAKALLESRKARDAILAVLARFPEIEARSLANEYERLLAAERALADGVQPPTAEALFDEFVRAAAMIEELQQAIKRMHKLGPTIQKVDADLGISLIRCVTDLSQIARRMGVHYNHMKARAKHLVTRSKTPPEGPVKRAYEAYKAALERIDGVHSVGALIPDLGRAMPAYELRVAVDPTILKDRSRLRGMEREADEIVEQRDPGSVGAIAFRFEPAAGDP